MRDNGSFIDLTTRLQGHVCRNVQFSRETCMFAEACSQRHVLKNMIQCRDMFSETCSQRHVLKNVFSEKCSQRHVLSGIFAGTYSRGNVCRDMFAGTSSHDVRSEHLRLQRHVGKLNNFIWIKTQLLVYQ